MSSNDDIDVTATSAGIATVDPELITASGGDDGALPLEELQQLLDPHEGRARVGRYAVLRELGRGAMGVVYAAYHEDLGRKVAVKVLARSRSGRRDHDRRLHREARALAKLSHPNVVQVYDVGEFEGHVYVAMEFVEGETLREWMGREQEVEAVLRLFIAAGRGLAAAHEAGVVHRDFKPENVIVARDGRPRVLDFGLARAVVHEFDETEDPSLGLSDSMSEQLDSEIGDEQLTQTGAQMGTPAYMSPEQHLGLPVGHGADQFSFCVALYEAVSGRRPFRARTQLGILMAIQDADFEPPRQGMSVPAWLLPILARGLSADPHARFDSMHALVSQLEQGPPEQARRRWLASSLWFALAVGTSALAVAHGPPVTVCPDPKQLVAQLPQAAVAPLLARNSAPYASRSTEEIERLWTQWRARWATQRAEACRATHLRHEFSTHVLARREACLDASGRAATRLFARLREGDLAALRAGVEALTTLPDPQACLPLDELSDTAHNPAFALSDESHVQLLELEVTAPIDRADPRWQARVSALLTQAHSARVPASEARLHLLLAPLEPSAGEELARLERALSLAEQAGEDEIIASAALATLEASLRLDPPDLLRAPLWARQLDASVSRIEASQLLAHALAAQARLALALERPAHALERAQASIVAFERHAPDALERGAALELLAQIHAALGDHPAATIQRSAARDFLRERLGPDHPRLKALDEP